MMLLHTLLHHAQHHPTLPQLATTAVAVDPADAEEATVEVAAMTAVVASATDLIIIINHIYILLE